MSFFHRCAVGFFERSSLVCGGTLRVCRPLRPSVVEALAQEYLWDDRPLTGRRSMWWEDDEYVVVEYVALRAIECRVAFIHSLMARTECDAVDVSGRVVLASPWAAS